MKFIMGGVGFCWVVYTAVGILSVFAFGSKLKGNVLDNISAMSSWESYVLRGIFLIVIAIHTPFVFFIGKEAMYAVLA